jgi:hypothetical protein
MHSSGRAVPAAQSGTPRAVRLPSAEKKQAGTSVRKKVRGTGKELLTAFAILAALGVFALIWWKQNERALQENKDSAAEQERIFKQNLQRGFDAYKRAESAGLSYVTAGEAAPDDKLFGPFRNDDSVFNAIYDRNYKSEHEVVMGEQKAMYKERTAILRLDDYFKLDEVTGVRCCYGFTSDKRQPLVVASKLVRPKEGDQVNLAGTITIVVKAENDDRFERARRPKAEHK